MQPRGESEETMMGYVTGQSSDDGAWQFVNLSDPAQRKSRDLKKVVRANAMRHYKKEQRQKVSAQHRDFKRTIPAGMVDTLAGVTRNDFPNRPRRLRPAVKPLKIESSALSLPSRRATDSGMDVEEAYRSHATEAEYLDEAQQYYLMLRLGKGNSLGLGSEDPFGTLPIGSCPGNTSHILHHCERPKR